MYLTDSNTIKICWYWPDTDTDTRISAALLQALVEWIDKTHKESSKCYKKLLTTKMPKRRGRKGNAPPRKRKKKEEIVTRKHFTEIINE